MSVKCESCGEIFRSLDSHVEHGGAFTCCKRKLAAAQVRIAEWEKAVKAAPGGPDYQGPNWYQRCMTVEKTLRWAQNDLGTARARVRELEAALRDMLAGWRYIRRWHGDLYGVGWDRAQAHAEKALAAATPEPAQPDPVREILMESVDACTIPVCKHCSWLGYRMGRLDGGDPVKPAQPRGGSPD